MQRPAGETEYVAWQDLRAVLIQTTDEGPWTVDVYWILLGDHGGCVVPQGAAGEEGLLARLQQLPGFDHGAVIAAMASTDNARFLCWERPATT